MTSIAALVWILVAQGASTPLSGTVVEQNGNPVVGAELVLVAPPPGLDSFRATPRVVARARSGEGGRFTIDRPTGLAGGGIPQGSPILRAAKPGFRIAATRFLGELPDPDEPLPVVLEPPGRARVRVVDPDGRPVAGAVVLPSRFLGHHANVPDDIAETAPATTGGDGVAILDAVSQDALSDVLVRTREYGSQVWCVEGRADDPGTVPLRPVSTWKGRLTAKDPAHVKGWKVRGWTTSRDDPDASPRTIGHAAAVADDEGRFAFAPIAVGWLRLELEPPGDLPVLANIPRNLSVRRGVEGAGEIALQRPVVIRGRILERGTGHPVAGAFVDLYDVGPGRSQDLKAETDAEGRYTFHALPGKLRAFFRQLPPSHVEADESITEDVEVAEGAEPVELATKEVLRAAPVFRGEVRDEEGRVVAGAEVQAEVRVEAGGRTTRSLVHKTSDAAGRFELPPLSPDAVVTIMASHEGRRTQPPLEVRPGVETPVKVVVSPMPLMSAVGRLTAPPGKALGGIPVRITFSPDRDAAGGLSSGRFTLPWYAAQPVTGPDGSFETPREIERIPGHFRATASAPGFRTVESERIPTPDGDVLRFPDMALTPTRALRVVEGRVLDREGKPVADARVHQAGDGPIWTSADADADGRYRLDGVVEGEALVFAEARGFRFGGAVVDGGGEVEIRLARRDEPPFAAPMPLPPPLGRAEEREMARGFVQPLIGAFRPVGPGVDAATIALARVDPAGVLAKIEERVIAPDDAVMAQVILGRFEDDPDAAIAVIRGDLAPASRAAGWLALESYRPAVDRARRGGFLEEALADARKVAEAGPRIRVLGRIADRWLELGELEKARPILLEGRDALADQSLTWDQSAWDRFSDERQWDGFDKVLAAVDLPAAIAILERRAKAHGRPLAADAVDRCKVGAAVRIARFRPEEAAALLADAPRSRGARAEILAAALGMAHVDPDRAARLLEHGSSGSRPTAHDADPFVSFGLGATAGEVAEPSRARTFLDEAFAGLRNQAEDDPGFGDDTLPCLMAELLPTIERVDPERLAERVWMLAASRPPNWRPPYGLNFGDASATAALVARYDRRIADRIAGPVLEGFAEAAEHVDEDTLMAIARNLTIYDPRVIPRLLGSLPESARKPRRLQRSRAEASIEGQVRLAAAQILGVPPEARRQEVRTSVSWLSR